MKVDSSSQKKTNKWAIILLVFLNLDKYLVRYLPSGAKPLLSAELHLTDTQSGFLYTAFLLTYIVMCPVSAFLGDSHWLQKRHLMALGVIGWSLSTAASSLCTNFVGFLITRIVTGVAECLFSTLGISFLADIVAPEDRNIATAWYYTMSPVGAACGYASATVVGSAIGWRTAFAITGVFGFAAIPLFCVPEPTVGKLDEIVTETEETKQMSINNEEKEADIINTESEPLIKHEEQPLENGSEKKTKRIKELKEAGKAFLTAEYLCAIFGYAMCGFALTGIDDWLTTLLCRFEKLSVSGSGIVSAISVIVGGVSGNFFGAFGANFVGKHIYKKQPELLFSGIDIALAGVAAFFAITATGTFSVLVSTVLWSCVYCFGTAYQTPIVVYIVTTIPPALRTTSSALMHLVGEIPCSAIIGQISDESSDLRQALLVAPFSYFIAGYVWFIGSLLIKPGEFRMKKIALQTQTPS